MAEIRGDVTRMGYENSDVGAGDPYGTALDLTSYTEARICAEITPAFVSEEAELSRIGCGGQSGFGTDCEIVNREYRFNLTGDADYQHGMARQLAQFMGESSVPAEQNVGEGDYLHLLTFAAQTNQHFGTLAYETTTTQVMEAKSTYTESISISMADVGQPIEYSTTLVSSDIEVSTPVNDNADLATLTASPREVIIPTCADLFRVKAINDDGLDTALASPTDDVDLLSFELEMERPLEVISELTGGDCGAPSESGFLTGTLTVTFKVHADNTVLSYQNWLDNDKYMADFTFTGTQIAAGDNRHFIIRIPKLCLVESPDYPVVDAGFNEYTLTFRILDSDNVIPPHAGNAAEFEFINERVGEYLLT